MVQKKLITNMIAMSYFAMLTLPEFSGAEFA